MTTTEYTKEIQKYVGVTADGIWGKKTATAVYEALRLYNQYLVLQGVNAEDGLKKLMEQEGFWDLKKIDPETFNPTEESYVDPVLENTAEPVTGQWTDLYEEDAITSEVHRKCIETLNVFESGCKDGDYCCVSVYKDGGGGTYKQLTYGKAQTTQDGHLDELLSDYLKTSTIQTPAYAVIKAHYPTKGKVEYATDKELIQALKDAGKEPAMQAAQDRLFEEKYFNPAYKWFHDNGFTLPLSMLVIYDSFIHSGGILAFLRKRFSEVPPARGGNEKKWIQEYVKARKSWLANHSNKVLRNTVYRMETMQKCIDAGNWDLSQTINANGIIIS